METLKLASLVLLIPIGSLLSDSAAAYPEPLDRIHVLEGEKTQARCSSKRLSQPNWQDQGNVPDVTSKFLEALIGPTTTMHLHQDHESQPDTCRLDLDLIETD